MIGVINPPARVMYERLRVFWLRKKKKPLEKTAASEKKFNTGSNNNRSDGAGSVWMAAA